jgi:(4-alkanoyl-5-oxo-2,5-dihydrofuran-3-yl)methyl phosphate reductase
VLLSSFTADLDLPSGDANLIAARHRAGERALREAGVPSTFLRAAGFDYNIGVWLAGAENGVVYAPYPDAALPVIDPVDIAAAAVAVLVSAEPAPAVYLITGPAAVTLREQVQTVNELTGRSLTVEQNTPEEAATRTFPAGTPDVVARSVLETMSPAAAAVPRATTSGV